MKKSRCFLFSIIFVCAILINGCGNEQQATVLNEQQKQAQIRLDPASLLENNIFEVSQQELEKMENVTQKNSVFSTEVTLYSLPGKVIYFFKGQNAPSRKVSGVTYFLKVPDPEAQNIIESIRDDLKIRFGDDYEETGSIQDTQNHILDDFSNKGKTTPISELWGYLSDHDGKIIQYQLSWKRQTYRPQLWIMSSKSGIDIQISFEA